MYAIRSYYVYSSWILISSVSAWAAFSVRARSLWTRLLRFLTTAGWFIHGRSVSRTWASTAYSCVSTATSARTWTWLYFPTLRGFVGRTTWARWRATAFHLRLTVGRRAANRIIAWRTITTLIRRTVRCPWRWRTIVTLSVTLILCLTSRTSAWLRRHRTTASWTCSPIVV